MKIALRTDVCTNCAQVLYEIETFELGFSRRTFWLHDDPERIHVGTIFNVNYLHLLFEQSDGVEIKNHLMRTDTNRPTAIFQGFPTPDRALIRVLPAFCGPSFLAVPTLDPSRNILDDCARCQQPVFVKRLSRRETMILHRKDSSPYCRATPFTATLD